MKTIGHGSGTVLIISPKVQIPAWIKRAVEDENRKDQFRIKMIRKNGTKSVTILNSQAVFTETGRVSIKISGYKDFRDASFGEIDVREIRNINNQVLSRNPAILNQVKGFVKLLIRQQATLRNLNSGFALR